MIEVKRYKEKARVIVYSGFELIPGNDLLSHAPTRAVPSAVAGLTSVFGMGTGVTLLLWPPGNLFRFRISDRVDVGFANPNSVRSAIRDRILVSGVPPEASYAASQEGRPRAFRCKEQRSYNTGRRLTTEYSAIGNLFDHTPRRSCEVNKWSSLTAD